MHKHVSLHTGNVVVSQHSPPLFISWVYSRRYRHGVNSTACTPDCHREKMFTVRFLLEALVVGWAVRGVSGVEMPPDCGVGFLRFLLVSILY